MNVEVIEPAPVVIMVVSADDVVVMLRVRLRVRSSGIVRTDLSSVVAALLRAAKRSTVVWNNMFLVLMSLAIENEDLDNPCDL